MSTVWPYVLPMSVWSWAGGLVLVRDITCIVEDHNSSVPTQYKHLQSYRTRNTLLSGLKVHVVLQTCTVPRSLCSLKKFCISGEIPSILSDLVAACLLHPCSMKMIRLGCGFGFGSGLGWRSYFVEISKRRSCFVELCRFLLYPAFRYCSEVHRTCTIVYLNQSWQIMCRMIWKWLVYVYYFWFEGQCTNEHTSYLCQE